MERKDEGEEWIIPLKQRKVRAENKHANLATDVAPPLTELLCSLRFKILSGHAGRHINFTY